MVRAFLPPSPAPVPPTRRVRLPPPAIPSIDIHVVVDDRGLLLLPPLVRDGEASQAGLCLRAPFAVTVCFRRVALRDDRRRCAPTLGNWSHARGTCRPLSTVTSTHSFLNEACMNIRFSTSPSPRGALSWAARALTRAHSLVHSCLGDDCHPANGDVHGCASCA